MKYYDLIRDMSTTFNLRLEIIRFAREHSLSQTALEFKTTRKTVRKWKVRYQAFGAKGLLDKSRAPHFIPHKTSQMTEAYILTLRDQHKKWGPQRLKMHYDIKASQGAISRILKQAGRIKRRKKKWKRRLDLRDKKFKMRAFEKVQTDTKDLKDIPEYYEDMVTKQLPKFQYGTRVMGLGAAFFSYADENNGTYAALHSNRVIKHLKYHGVEVEKMEEQTDNGSEYIGNVKKKGPSPYQLILKTAKVTHSRIPPRHCTWNSDIERFNGLCEEEFYMCERFNDNTDFLAKSHAYHLFFNYARKNRWWDNKSPIEILREKMPEADEQVLNLPPIRLETLLATGPIGGYHVPASVKVVGT